MQLCDHSIYYPCRQVVKQCDLCLWISKWSSSVCVRVLLAAAVQRSQVTVITECLLYAAWEVNTSMLRVYLNIYAAHSIRSEEAAGGSDQRGCAQA